MMGKSPCFKSPARTRRSPPAAAALLLRLRRFRRFAFGLGRSGLRFPGGRGGLAVAGGFSRIAAARGRGVLLRPGLVILTAIVRDVKTAALEDQPGARADGALHLALAPFFQCAQFFGA